MNQFLSEVVDITNDSLLFLSATNTTPSHLSQKPDILVVGLTKLSAVSKEV